MKSEQSCAKCGETRGYVLDYHHLDPTAKEEGIARMTSNNYRLDAVMEEIKKCVVLCANCHREFHYLEDREQLTIEKYLKRD
jgi:predicted HNH restriction endonuclease